MGDPVSILVWLLVFAIIVYGVHIVLGMLTLPPPIKALAYLIVAVVFLIVLLRVFGVMGGRAGGPPLGCWCASADNGPPIERKE